MKVKGSVMVLVFVIPAVLLLAGFLAKTFLINPAVTSKPSKAEVVQKVQKLQIPFIANEGQTDEEVGFYANTFGGTVFVTKDGEIVYSFMKNSSELEVGSLELISLDKETSNNQKSSICNLKSSGARRLALREELINGNITEISGEAKSVTRVSYFKGNDPSRWKSNISTYDEVTLGEIYNGIELKLKAYGNNVEKLFYVKPDADTEAIQIELSGAKGLWINEEGQLVVETELGAVKFTKPVAYQEIDGKKIKVYTEYVIRDREPSPVKDYKTADTDNEHSSRVYGFKVASYDKSKELIIDPLLASTYLGGSNGDEAYSISIDFKGNIYVCGWTDSSNFPTTAGAYNTALSGYEDAFISKLDGGLSNLLASTYLGGNGYDVARSMSIDSKGNIYVCGWTDAYNFPTTKGAYDTSFNGYEDAFISKLNSGLTKLLASTYLGGSNGENGASSMSIDSKGNIYVCGWTYSSDFPTTTFAYDTSFSGDEDAFTSKLNSGLTNLLASTYLGGTGRYDEARCPSIDSKGNIYDSVD